MIYINLLTRYTYNNFIHQLDIDRYKNEICFFENSNEDIIWDLLVVYEDVLQNQTYKVKEGGLLFISGEPPSSTIYPPKFLSQFDTFITSHKKLHHKNNILSQQALNWHFGYNFKTNTYQYNYNDLKSLTNIPKTKKISVIASSKKMMQGHNVRYSIVNKLKEKYSDKIDFFGRDTNPIDDKAEAILPYQFHICIENSFIDDYWTEKFADPILGESIPIYIGCTNIKKYFSDDFYFNFKISEINNLYKLIDKILEDGDEIYNEKINLLRKNKNILLDKYNIFPLLENYYDSLKQKDKQYKIVNIRNSNDFKVKMWLMFFLRVKRKIYSTFYNMFRQD